jgi:hypothetical protein
MSEGASPPARGNTFDPQDCRAAAATTNKRALATGAHRAASSINQSARLIINLDAFRS